MISQAVLALAFLVPVPAAAAARADAEGWAGEGWYVSSDISAATSTRGLRTNILFNGPHMQESQCAAIYQALYSPIGDCRHFTSKPMAPMTEPAR